MNKFIAVLLAVMFVFPFASYAQVATDTPAVSTTTVSTTTQQAQIRETIRALIAAIISRIAFLEAQVSSMNSHVVTPAVASPEAVGSPTEAVSAPVEAFSLTYLASGDVKPGKIKLAEFTVQATTTGQAFDDSSFSSESFVDVSNPEIIVSHICRFPNAKFGPVHLCTIYAANMKRGVRQVFYIKNPSMLTEDGTRVSDGSVRQSVITPR